MPNEGVFKGSRTAYIGIAIIASVLGSLGYALDMSVFYGLTGIAAAIGAYGSLFDRVSAVITHGDALQVLRGDLQRSMSIPLNSIKSMTLSVTKNKPEPANAILDMNLDEVKFWEDFKYLVIEFAHGKKRFSIALNDFTESDFIAMVKGVKEQYLEEGATPAQKAQRVLQQTNKYIANDKHLRNELKTSLVAAYTAIYKPQETLLSKQVMQEMEEEPGVLFYTVKQGNVLLYFHKDKPRHDIDPGNIPIAQGLIETGHHNLEIVENRLASHEQVKERLERMVVRFEQQQSLDQVASKLNKLQQQNIETAVFKKDVSFEAEVVEQLHQLSQEIYSAQTLEQSQALIEHVKQLKR